MLPSSTQALHYSDRDRSTWMAAQHRARPVFWSLVRFPVAIRRILT